MQIRQYLQARGESIPDFAERAGIIRQTLQQIIGGTRPRIDIAYRIVMASRAQPAPDGGTITFEALAESHIASRTASEPE